MLFLYISLSLILGIAIGYLYVSLQTQKQIENQIIAHPITTQLRINTEQLKTELIAERDGKQQYSSALATAKAELAAMTDKLNTQLKDVQELKVQFKLEFENLANKIFEDKSEKFTQQNRDQLDIVLNPFKEKLRDFENKVDKVYKEENNERINLKAELKQLSDMNKQLSSDANNLATALKGSNKQQGNWGEMILEKILERSGLQNGVEFLRESTDENANGERIRPDVVIHLPDGKHIIVDSKVSLIGYNNMMASGTDEERMTFLKTHVDSIRSHIKILSEKNYSSAKNLVTPDFVLLFMPLEAAFSTAMQDDSELYNYAWDRKVVLVSPTTLLATLRTVASIWSQEKRTRNAEEIAQEAGKLYDKFVGFVEDLLKAGNKLKDAKEAYEGAMNKLSTGSGNLVNRAEKMKQLGIKVSKEMNPQLVERSNKNELLP